MTAYASEVLADAPLLYWRLGESSGTVADDTSGNGRTGTYVNGPTLGTTGLLDDNPNTAVTFTAASDQHADSNATFSPGSTSAYSIEAIVKPTATALVDSAANVLCIFEMAGSPDFLGLALDNSVVTFYADPSFDTATGGVLVAGTRYHLVGVYDGTNILLYVNGTLAGSTPLAGPIAFSSADTFYVGSTGGDPFDGVIDECAFYASALSAERVAAHYAAVTDGGPDSLTYTPPIAYDMGPIIPDTQGLQRLLFRHYSPHGRFQTVWKLATDPITYSLTQPYPLITPEDVNQGNTPIGQQYTDATYLYVYYGPELVDADEAARLVASGIGTVT